MNDSGTNYGDFEPIISNRIEQLYYLKDKALSHQANDAKTFEEDQLFSTAQFCLEVEEKVNDTIGFLMCNRVAPVVFKQYLNVLKTLNEYVITTKGNLKENNYLEKLEEIEYLNQRIDIALNAAKDSSFLPECSEIKHQIQEFIKVSETPVDYLNIEDSISENKYPRIFKNSKGFDLFEELVEEIEINSTKPPVSDCSFIFRIMKSQELIHDSVTHYEIKTVFSNYNIDIDQLKTLESVSNNNRIKNYNRIKDKIFKLK